MPLPSFCHAPICLGGRIPSHAPVARAPAAPLRLIDEAPAVPLRSVNDAPAVPLDIIDEVTALKQQTLSRPLCSGTPDALVVFDELCI
jgi:hypothetical protein